MDHEVEVAAGDRLLAAGPVAGSTGARRVGARALAGVDRAVEIVMATALVAELIVLFSNMVARAAFGYSIAWSQEASRLSLIVLAFLGGAAAYGSGEHMVVSAVRDRFPPRSKHAAIIAAEWLVLAVVVDVAVLSFDQLTNDWELRSTTLHLRETWFDLPLTVGLILVARHSVARLLRETARVRPTLIGVVALIAVFALFGDSLTTVSASSGPPIAVCLALFAVTLALGVPVAFALLAGSLAYLCLSGVSAPLVVVANMADGVNSFVLLALPFFVLAGGIMTIGGLSRRLSDVASTALRRVRNGMLQVSVVTMFVFSGISGSKAADMAAVGSSMSDESQRQGYPPSEIVAVLASSASMGESIPPSIALLVLASVSSLSVGALFLAGILPAVVMALCLMVLIALKPTPARLVEVPATSLRAGVISAVNALPVLALPLILLGGILLGIGTPTEASSVAVVYGLLLAGAIYRTLSWRSLWRLLLETARMSGMVLFVIAAATAFGRVLIIAEVPQSLVNALQSLDLPTALFLLLAVVLLIVMGAVLEGLPAVLVFAPLLLPAATDLGVDQVHFGILLIIAVGIGAFSPPFGVGFYIACAIGKSTPEKAMRAMLPYLVALYVGVLVVAFVPWLSVTLPSLFHTG